MSKSITELIANSFDALTFAANDQAIALPLHVIEVMGRQLKGEVCTGAYRYLLVSKLDDPHFKGVPLLLDGSRLTLPPPLLQQMPMHQGVSLICIYHGAGDYVTIKRAAYEYG